MVHKRARLSAVSESPPHCEMPPEPVLRCSEAVNRVFQNALPHQGQKTVTVENRTITELQPAAPVYQENSAHAEPLEYRQLDYYKKLNDADTVTVCSVAVSESAVIKHTIQVRKDHQLPIQRLLKPEEYEAIRASPKRLSLSPIKPVLPRRIPFSPRNQVQHNDSPIVKSKAQVALFASPPPKNRDVMDCIDCESPARSHLLSSPITHSPGVYMTSTPNRRMSPRKFDPNNTTPIRQSPRKHFNSSPQLKYASGSPRKYSLYATPSPVSYRLHSPRKASLFASRLVSHSSPVKRASPIKLFSSPPSSQTKLRMSPRKCVRSKDILKEFSPLKPPAVETAEHMNVALALIELSGGH